MRGDVVIHRQKDRVSVGYTRTINLGNYESVKVDVGYGTDVAKTETVDAAFDRADRVASEKLMALCEPLQVEKPRKKKKRRD